MGISLLDPNFRIIVTKPDNVPIVGLIFLVGFFTWLALHQGFANDRRIEEGKLPAEKETPAIRSGSGPIWFTPSLSAW